MPDALLLELDALVVGSLAARRDAVRRSLPGGVARDEARLAQRLERGAGLSAADALRIADGGQSDETALELAALDASRRYRAWLAQGVTLVEGAASLVADAAAHAPVAVVTRGAREEAAMVLALAGLEDAVACVVAAEDAPRGRPAADAHALALGRLARRRTVRAERVLAVEDSAAGIAAARAAGLSVVAVGALPAHEAAEANAYVPSLAGHTLRSLAALAGGRATELRP